MATDHKSQVLHGIQKEYGNGSDRSHLHDTMDSEEAVRRIQNAGSISISPELFEKIYLSPQNQVKGELRMTFGNPTPLALCGFLLSLSPLSCDLMGWQGTNGPTVGAAGVATYFYGGIIMMLAGVGEWILGNTFSFVVFGSYGSFWLALAGTLQPSFNAWGAYATDPNDPTSGLRSAPFHASFAFYLLAMGILSFVYLICSLRTNISFVVIFFTLGMGFTMLAGAYWQVSKGNDRYGTTLQITSGAFFFVSCGSGWWIFLAIMLATLDFPVSIPVGDLTRLIKPASERIKEAV